jgi:hypothetical protein
MAAAIALAIVLVIAVAGMSLAMQAQRPLQPNRPRPTRPTRPVRDRSPLRPTGGAPGRARRARDRPAPAPPPDPEPMVAAPIVEPKGPELLRTGVAARAKVVNVVDERVVGPVTRSRLTITITPEGGDPFEVTIRHAFPTPDARGRVRIGGGIAVRYDADDHHKVVIDPAGD